MYCNSNYSTIIIYDKLFPDGGMAFNCWPYCRMSS